MGIAYNTSIVRDGLVLHLDAANIKSYPGTGTVWKDLSGLGNDGTLVDGVGYNTANNGSMVFDGVNDIADIADSVTLGVQYITMSVWLKWNSAAGSGRSYVLDGQSHKSMIFIDKPNAINFVVVTQGGGTRYNTKQLPEITTNIWCNLTGTYDGQVSKLYLNDTLVQEISYSISPISVVPGIARVGSYIGSASAYATAGSISYAQIYNRALSPAEVKQNFEAMRGRYGI